MKHRNPYVGEGADGARRSAQIDREEADGLDLDDPRHGELISSAIAWDAQAEELEAATSTDDERPGTVAECLDHIAFHLADTDKIIAAYCGLVGKANPISGTEAQVDLAVWAAWLREHPDVDAELMAAVKDSDARQGSSS